MSSYIRHAINFFKTKKLVYVTLDVFVTLNFGRAEKQHRFDETKQYQCLFGFADGIDAANRDLSILTTFGTFRFCF